MRAAEESKPLSGELRPETKERSELVEDRGETYTAVVGGVFVSMASVGDRRRCLGGGRKSYLGSPGLQLRG